MYLKTIIVNIAGKLHGIGYLNRGIIFALDLVLSLSGALTSLLIMRFSLGASYPLGGGGAGAVIALTLALTAGLMLLTASYRMSIRCSTLREQSKLFGLLTAKGILMSLSLMVFGVFSWRYASMYGILDILVTSFLTISFRTLVVILYHAAINTPREEKDMFNTLVYGALGNAPLLAAQINDNVKSPYKVIGFLGADPRECSVRIAGQHVYCWNGDMAALERIVAEHNITYILFTNAADFDRERGRLVDFCIERNIRMLMGGKVEPLDDGSNIPNLIKPVGIEELLDRAEIGMDMGSVAEQAAGKTVLLTGAAGSIGREIALQLAGFDVARLVLLDIAETPLHNISLELKKAFPHKDISYILSDVRSLGRMQRVFEQYRPDYVFHAAAYKHVPIIESYPCEGVLTNIAGTLNTARCARAYGAEKFVMISTDKAINPTNVMGASKRIAELCVQGMNGGKTSTQFIITRFGNVLGSNGSVIPIFREQIARGGPVTVTHPDMIRYFMTVSEACRLVLQAAAMGRGGEIFVFDMGQQVKIDSLARRMILLSGLVPDEDIRIEYTGLRPGEKLFEELLTEAESTKMTENEKIRIALVDAVDADALEGDLYDLIRAAGQMDVERTIFLMKRIVPEFKSNNSVFEVFDRREAPVYTDHADYTEARL